MKMLIIKITSFALLLVATLGFVNVQTANASAEAPTQKIEIVDLDHTKTLLGVSCNSWVKIGTGSECTCYHNGYCIGNRYWDKERRVCGIPGSSWWWYEYRNTNYRTSGPSC